MGCAVNGADRSCLFRQGFMNIPAARATKAMPPMISCDGCLNWHRKGKHLLDAATRKANVAMLYPNGRPS